MIPDKPIQIQPSIFFNRIAIWPAASLGIVKPESVVQVSRFGILVFGGESKIGWGGAGGDDFAAEGVVFEVGVDIAVGEVDVFADVAVGIEGGSPGVGALANEEETPYPACALERLREVETPDVVLGVGEGEDIVLEDEVPAVVEVAEVRGQSLEVRVENRFAHAAALAVEGVLDGEVAFVDADHAVLAVPFEGGAFAVVGEVAVVVVRRGNRRRGRRHSDGGILVERVGEVGNGFGFVGSGNRDAVADLIEVVAGVSVAHGGGGDF